MKDEKEEDDDGLNVSNCCKVVIIGTNLKSFHYDGDCSDEYILYDSASVINASINVQVPPQGFCDEDYGCLLDLGYYVFKLLGELPNVEKLSINHAFPLALSRTGLLLKYMPFFPKLVELNLDTTTKYICLSYPGLLAMFHNSPNLEVIRFEGGVSLPKDDATYILDCIPLCFSTDLKTIEICNFNGAEEELFAIKVLLKAASSLGKLIIRCHSRSSDFDDIDSHRGERSEKLHKQILRYPKRSMDCEMDFQHIMR
ncbi:hypothetical protein PIB30_014188 [Stylosanthes scabra]|uniref:FBD domain-containing protein n=1 Tax=Stylosanthes scabra TaxID=79078 RepID=A0ABU6V9W6_9FABA|nr:hypothetical protein [Stylosanthes scabra]